MVAKRYAENFLGFVLFDYKTIQIRLDLVRGLLERERFGLRAGLRGLRCSAVGLSRSGRAVVLKMLPQKIRQLALKIFGRWHPCKSCFCHAQKSIKDLAWTSKSNVGRFPPRSLNIRHVSV